MDADEQELGNLAREIDAVRKHCFRSREYLRLAVQELTGTSGTADELVLIADEHGLEALAEELATCPRARLSTALPRRAGERVGGLLDLTEVAVLADRELNQLAGLARIGIWSLASRQD